MTTYGTMQDRIADEINRSDLTTQIQRAIQSAIAHYEAEKFWFNEAATDYSLSSSVATLSVPSGWVEIDDITYTDAGGNQYRLNRRSYDWYREVQTGTSSEVGEVTDYSIFADAFYLYPTPNANRVVTISGTKQLSTLSSTTDSNAWMTNGEELIRQRAKWYLWTDVVVEPERAALASSAEMRAYERIKRQSGHKLFSGRVKPTHF